MISDTAASTSTPRVFSRRRSQWLRAFLWLSAVGWGIGLGAKLFDLLVLARSWGASPPASLSLMPYGKDLWGVRQGTLSLSNLQIHTLVHQWFVWDGLRTALIAIGFVSSLHTLSSAPRHGL